LKTTDERELSIEKSSNSPPDGSNTTSIPSLRSVLRLPEAHKTYDPVSACDVLLDSSQNLSMAPSDCMEQNSMDAAIFSPGMDEDC